MKQKYDAILVLGMSTKKKMFSKRVEKAVWLYKSGIAPKIIFSGRWWGGRKTKLKKTEAESMKEYALQIGASQKDILIENLSLNTAGNFYFTKKLILKPNKFFHILVITHLEHIPKSRYLGRKILGPKYCLKWLDDGMQVKGIFKRHNNKLEETKKYFSKIKNGDDRTIAELLLNHPHYKKYYNHYRKHFL